MSEAVERLRNVERWKIAGAHPRAAGALLLTAFLAAATVPALLSWTSFDQGRVLRSRQEEFFRLLRVGVEGRRESLPSRVVTGSSASEFVRIPTGAGQDLKSTLLFTDQQVDLFRQKSTREGEFERALKPPDAVNAKATRDVIEVTWAAPADLDHVRAALRDHSLLRLGFRVYRWREGEEPQRVFTSDGNQTAYEDRDLPLWRARFFYCVATVLEGTIGELPTLIESKRSSVITVETVENFELEVLDGSEERAQVRLSACLDGEWRREVIELAPGDHVRAAIQRKRDGVVADFSLDSGLCVRELHRVAGKAEAVVQRAEFLPDGRRKLDPETGRPTFRNEPISVATHVLEVVCSEPSGALRTFASPTIND